MKYNRLNNNGSSLTMTLVIMMILTILGLAIISNTMSNMSASIALTDYEKAYYCAQTAVTEALAAVKEQANRQYTAMYNAATEGDYNYQFHNFFLLLENAASTASAGCVFVEPDFTESIYSGSTTTQIIMDPASSSWPIGYVPDQVTIRISSTASVNDASRTLHAELELANPGLDFDKTSAPPINTEMVMLGGDAILYSPPNDAMTATGHGIVWGDIGERFSCLLGITNPYTDADTTNYDVDKVIDWHLDYTTFLGKLPNTQAAMVDPILPGLAGYTITSTQSNWGSGFGTTNVSNQVISVTGDLTMNRCNLTNCIIQATGRVTISGLPSLFGSAIRINGCQITAGTGVFIETCDLENTAIRAETGNIDLEIGTDLHPGDISTCHINAVNGSMTVESNDSILSILFSEKALSNIQNSNIYSNGTLRIGQAIGLGLSVDVGNIRDCYVVSEGNMTIATTVMNASSYGKCLGRSKQGSLVLNNIETDDCMLFARYDITLDSQGFALTNVQPSQNSVFVAGDDITVRNAKISDCYIFADDALTIDLEGSVSGLFGLSSYVYDSIIYAENSLNYTNDWSAWFDAVRNCLAYTNGDFNYDGSGSDTSSLFGQGNFATQLVVRGNIYSKNNSYQDLLYIGIPPDSSYYSDGYYSPEELAAIESANQVIFDEIDPKSTIPAQRWMAPTSHR